jgi:hypothetical protein
LVAYQFAIVSVDNRRPKCRSCIVGMGAVMSVWSAQPPETMPRKTTDDVVDSVGKIVHYAVNESSFQFARLPVAQLYAHEEQHAFDEHGLASRSNMPDCFLGVTLSARVVGGRVAARLHCPKINPRRLALVTERHGAECRKSPGVVDDGRGICGDHGDGARYPAQPKIFRPSVRRPPAAVAWRMMYAGFDAAHANCHAVRGHQPRQLLCGKSRNLLQSQVQYNKFCCMTRRVKKRIDPMSNRTLLACPFCGKELCFFESFPGQSGLPEVHVFACEACEKMILQDPVPSSAAPGAKPAPRGS